MITVLGGQGFIGRRLVERLDELEVEHHAPAREAPLTGKNLGHVIYCIGLTADFRARPFDTVDAHVCKLLEVLRDCDFDSLLYLSSTRLYGAGAESTKEQTELRVTPSNPSDLYNLSKAMGESLALNCGKRTRVARISNVYGPDFTSDNFLATVIKQAVRENKVVLQTSSASAKDYVSLDDVVNGLIDIATKGQEQIYNVASGANVSNRKLAASLQSLTGCVVEFAAAAPTISFPVIDSERMKDEFNFRPANVLSELAGLIALYREHQGIAE
jgi:nucleoside-diphosphate-sugar epimerase